MDSYAARINRVIDYIDAHLGEELELGMLAELACFSKFHFHRLFAAHAGETLGAFIQRLRLQKAARLLRDDPGLRVTDVALDCGFSGSAAFARSFKERYGMSAMDWRRGGSNPGNIDGKRDERDGKGRESPAAPRVYVSYAAGAPLWRLTMDAKEASVEIRTIGKKRLAYVRHTGPYAGDSALFGRLFGKIYAWAGARGLLGPGSMTLVIYHDDPDTVAQDKLRTSVCVTVPDGQEASGEIGLMDLSAGQYGVGRFTVAPDGYGEAWNWMYGTWLPQSGFLPDDRQCFESYPEPMMADGRCVVEIWIPVKPA